MTNKTLTGLEAIKFMEQGGKVCFANDDKAYYKIKDGKVWLVTSSAMGEAVKFDFSDAYEEYNEPKPKKLIGWERSKEGEPYYKLTNSTSLSTDIEEGYLIDSKCCDNANYFSTKEKAEEINFKQTLFRKLQRFSDENGGNEIEWADRQTPKFNICYDHSEEEIVTEWFYDEHYFGSVYFISEEVAQQAIDLFHDDLMKYFKM